MLHFEWRGTKVVTKEHTYKDVAVDFGGPVPGNVDADNVLRSLRSYRRRPPRPTSPIRLPSAIRNHGHDAVIYGQDLPPLDVHHNLAIRRVFRIHGILTPGNERIPLRRPADAAARRADEPLRVIPLVHHPVRHGDIVELDLEAPRAV